MKRHTTKKRVPKKAPDTVSASILYGPSTHPTTGSCFLDVALVSLLHHKDPALFHLLKPVTEETPILERTTRNNLVIAHEALQSGKVHSVGGWPALRTRIRVALASKHGDKKEWLTEQQDSRAVVAMLLDLLHATDPHTYDETNHKGTTTTVQKSIYRETLLPAKDAADTTLPADVYVFGAGTVMTDIVTDGSECHVLRSLNGAGYPTKLCWYFGIRRVSDMITEGGIPTEILTEDRAIMLPDTITVHMARKRFKTMNLISIVLRTLGTIHGGHYVCLILREGAWWLYDGLDGNTAFGSLTKITEDATQNFDELLRGFAIVGAYYQE